MHTNTFLGRPVEVDDEGFLSRPEQWDADLAAELGRIAGVDEMTAEHWRVVHFARDDFDTTGEAPTLRRMQKTGGFDIKQLFALFPGKPAKKIAYIAGRPKPRACV